MAVEIGPKADIGQRSAVLATASEEFPDATMQAIAPFLAEETPSATAMRGSKIGTMIEQTRQWARIVKRDAHAIYLAARDPRVPWYAKALALCVDSRLRSGPRLCGRCHHRAAGNFGRREADSAGDHGGTSRARSGGAGSAREPQRRDCDRHRLGGMHRALGMALLSLFRRVAVLPYMAEYGRPLRLRHAIERCAVLPAPHFLACATFISIFIEIILDIPAIIRYSLKYGKIPCRRGFGRACPGSPPGDLSPLGASGTGRHAGRRGCGGDRASPQHAHLSLRPLAAGGAGHGAACKPARKKRIKIPA